MASLCSMSRELLVVASVKSVVTVVGRVTAAVVADTADVVEAHNKPSHRAAQSIWVSDFYGDTRNSSLNRF
ncbi:MAG TPA: hypothetical protein VJZ94_00195 [Candidatus Paceibacterota bacterium]|nr:hypothetical protein [Candidatus Paceibacterota bacterium]